VESEDRAQGAGQTQEPASVAEEPAPPAVVRSGEEVFQSLCAMCHGVLGDGEGVTQLDRKARSFLQGGFSFGNTPEAVFRTVSAGIGGTPMPGFGEVISEEERRAVAAYVIGLGPAPEPIPEGSTLLEVRDRPLVVRGGFPPVAEGLSMVPRGMLLGGLDGLSFQYDVSDVRLLCVRQGTFVDRRDWKNRGGDTLLPTGKEIYLVDGGTPQGMWMLPTVAGSNQVLQAQLSATQVKDGQVWIEYQLSGVQGPIARVRETGSALSLGGWSGFRRNFEIELTSVASSDLQLNQAEDGSVKPLFQDQPGQTILLHDDQLGASVRRVMRKRSGKHITLQVDTLFGLEGTPGSRSRFLQGGLSHAPQWRDHRSGWYGFPIRRRIAREHSARSGVVDRQCPG
jgi:mono/diheme cytochrome c family protein